MSDLKRKLCVRNRKSAEQMVISENAELEFTENPHTKNIFFVCGEIRGYVSPAIKAVMDTVNLDQLQVAECKKPELPDVNPETGESNWVPTLMMVGHSKDNVKRSLGGNLLR